MLYVARLSIPTSTSDQKSASDAAPLPQNQFARRFVLNVTIGRTRPPRTNHPTTNFHRRSLPRGAHNHHLKIRCPLRPTNHRHAHTPRYPRGIILSRARATRNRATARASSNRTGGLAAGCFTRQGTGRRS